MIFGFAPMLRRSALGAARPIGHTIEFMNGNADGLLGTRNLPLARGRFG
jgi:hypothetical protein